MRNVLKDVERMTTNIVTKPVKGGSKKVFYQGKKAIYQIVNKGGREFGKILKQGSRLLRKK